MPMPVVQVGAGIHIRAKWSEIMKGECASQ